MPRTLAALLLTTDAARGVPPARRAALTAMAALLLAACTVPERRSDEAGTTTFGRVPAEAPVGAVIDVASGRDIGVDGLLAAAAQSDFLLLGELHDNPRHHVLRGALLSALAARAARATGAMPGTGPVIVAEHLPRGARVTFTGRSLEVALSEAGFDRRAWRWPMHEPLFAAVRDARLALWGGNAERDPVREVARRGAAALPGDLAPLINAAPLATAAREALERDLVRGHCGQLAGDRLMNMTWAQRTRDAAMAGALLDAAKTRGAARPVAVLVAGNGHVQNDYGVAQVLATQRPTPRVLSVGFLEEGSRWEGAPFNVVWITPTQRRQDPCRAFAAPSAGSASAPASAAPAASAASAP